MKSSSHLVKTAPVLVGHLKVVALVGREVQSRLVASESKVFLFGSGTDSRIRLCVQVAPKMLSPRWCRMNANRIAGVLDAFECHQDATRAGCTENQLARFDGRHLRQTAPSNLASRWRRITPTVSSTNEYVNRLSDPAVRRQNSDGSCRWTSDDGKHG